jgi:hypothetical protein
MFLHNFPPRYYSQAIQSAFSNCHHVFVAESTLQIRTTQFVVVISLTVTEYISFIPLSLTGVTLIFGTVEKADGNVRVIAL